jgi:hypothetical protein
MKLHKKHHGRQTVEPGAGREKRAGKNRFENDTGPGYS